MLKKLLLTSSVVLLFSGCGEIEFPESAPVATPTPTISTTPQSVNPEASPETSDAAVSIENISEEYKKAVAERDNLKEAVKIAQDEIKTCALSKAEIEAKLATQSSTAQTKAPRFAPFLTKYLAEVKQAEYPFNPAVCGGLGKATSQTWYADFVLQLQKSGIEFAPLHRPLKADDLEGVCASTEGKIAVFLGASYKGKSDFHLIKYNIETKTLEEAVLLNGTCEICPSQFGKRFGPALTLTGQSGTKKKVYEYFYDANILKEK